MTVNFYIRISKNHRARETSGVNGQKCDVPLTGKIPIMGQNKYKMLCDRFPDHIDLIHRLIRENICFDDIVHDYVDVVDVLTKWRISEDPVAESRIKEYRELRSELEAEIEQFLVDAVKSTSS